MKYYNTRTDLLTLIPEKCTFLELGVFRGEFARDIIKIAKPSKIFLVDIWDGSAGSGDKDGNNHYSVSDMKGVYLDLMWQSISHDNVHLIRCDSVSFLQSCSDNYFDSIYVDADHSEEAVYNDMVNSLRVIKPGGFLMGHDYHHQIKIAVDRFCRDYNQVITGIANDGCPSFLIQIKK